MKHYLTPTLVALTVLVGWPMTVMAAEVGDGTIAGDGLGRSRK